MDISKLAPWLRNAIWSDATANVVNAALILGLYAGMLWLPILSFSGYGDQSLSDVAWYLAVDGIDRSYWASVAMVGFVAAIGAVGALFVALTVHIVGLALHDRGRTLGGGMAAAICLVALPPLFRPLSTGMLDAVAYGLPVLILYLVSVMGWGSYGRHLWDRKRLLVFLEERNRQRLSRLVK